MPACHFFLAMVKLVGVLHKVINPQTKGRPLLRVVPIGLYFKDGAAMFGAAGAVGHNDPFKRARRVNVQRHGLNHGH